MLSLARRPGQKIRIGEDIILVVREIRGRQVKIGIEAPSHVRVLREEIYEEMCAANKESVTGTDVSAALMSLGAKKAKTEP